MWNKIEGVEDGHVLDGKWVVTKKEIAQIMNIGVKQIDRYVLQGMPKHESSLPRFQIYSVQDCTEWKSQNVQKGKSASTQKAKNRSVEVEIPDIEAMMDESSLQELDSISFEEAERREKILKVKLAQVKLDTENGKVILATDQDKAMAEQATIHYSDITNDEKIFPTLLANKTEQEIVELYREHKQDRKKMFEKLVNKVFKSVSTLYDIVQEVLEELSNGAEPDDIIRRVKGK